MLSVDFAITCVTAKDTGKNSNRIDNRVFIIGDKNNHKSGKRVSNLHYYPDLQLFSI
jgi:hypothetical protein